MDENEGSPVYRSVAILSTPINPNLLPPSSSSTNQNSSPHLSILYGGCRNELSPWYGIGGGSPVLDRAIGLDPPLEPKFIESEWSFKVNGSSEKLFALVKDAFDREKIAYQQDNENMFHVMGSTTKFTFRINVFQSASDEGLYVVEVQRRSGDMIAFEEFYDWLNAITARAETRYSILKPSLSRGKSLESKISDSLECPPVLIDSLCRILSSSTSIVSDKLPAVHVLRALSQMKSNSQSFRECPSQVLWDAIEQILSVKLVYVCSSTSNGDPSCDEFLHVGVAFIANLLGLSLLMDTETMRYDLVVPPLFLCMSYGVEHLPRTLLLVRESGRCVNYIADTQDGCSQLLPYSNQLKNLIVECEDMSCAVILERAYGKILQHNNNASTRVITV